MSQTVISLLTSARERAEEMIKGIFTGRDKYREGSEVVQGVVESASHAMQLLEAAGSQLGGGASQSLIGEVKTAQQRVRDGLLKVNEGAAILQEAHQRTTATIGKITQHIQQLNARP